MTLSKHKPRVILIGGSSHVGKSTLARALGARPGWLHISTDSLARHPGRPWPQEDHPVPPHVAEHYLSLSVDELLADVLRHYRSMWPDIQSLITAHVGDPNTDRLVLEGSALWPASVATLELEGARAIWLTADRHVLETRIRAASRIDDRSGQGRAMIEKFIDRTHAYNAAMMLAVVRLGLPAFDVGEAASQEDLAGRVLKRLS